MLSRGAPVGLGHGNGSREMARRAHAWGLVAVVLFAGLAFRLFQIQVLGHAHHRRRAEATQGRRWPIPAPRGNLYDRNGTPLALNLKLYSIAADPKLIAKPKWRARQLAPLLRMPAAELASKLAPKEPRWVPLRASVDEPVATRVRKLDCAGVIVSTEWQRAYPHLTAAAAVLGFVGKDRRGLAGLEAAADRWLRGRDGEMMVVLDGRRPGSRGEIPGRTVLTREMVPGSSVVLTLDLEIQAIAEEALAKAVEAAQAKGGTALVMDPETGDILALATLPGFDPNQFTKFPPETWVSQAIASPYEPGSTFKVITAAAALEEGVMSHGETYHCSGSRPVGNRTISCALHGGTRAHGLVDLDQMVVKSCNVGMGTLAMLLGASRLHHWAQRLGFGQRTGIELGGESPGRLAPPSTWSLVQTANVGFGQGVSVTALQLLRAYAAIANGGWLVAPRLVKAIMEPGGGASAPTRPARRRVLSAATCRRLRSDLEKVVEEGTGTRAQVPGRRVAGKTGTAQKPMPGVGYRSGKYIGSFVGFAPVDKPRLAVLVAIDEPQGSHYGGVVAAPAFREICERALAYLRVPPDGPRAAELTIASGAPATGAD